jgi:predicted AlkP superfamily phosphohydrolase/phosphomutase
VAPRLVVLGWDSATFEVADPLLERGRLPFLAALRAEGASGPLRSSWPPMTDSAWTGAFTGLNAGAHGIFGSWYRAPGEYRCRYFSSRDRKAPALWELAGGARFLLWNVPMTYPPESIDGVMVAGYGAPPGARFCEPVSFQDELARRYELEDILDRAPHGSLESFLDDLLRGMEVQADALVWGARESGADCVLAVWPHIDRAQHFFWRFRGTGHALAGAVERVYEATDRASAKIAEAFPDADVMVISDHGAGPLKADVNVGSWLIGRGLAATGSSREGALLRLAWAAPPKLRRLGRKLFPGAARAAFSATLAGQLGPFDWSATKAFMGFHSDLWLNLEGREPAGCVRRAEAGALLDDIAAGLLELTHPETGERLFAAAYRRDEIFSGPAAELAPDLLLDPWTQGYRVAPSRGETGSVVIDPEPLAGVEAAWSADHRPLGIFAAAGPRLASRDSGELSLLDVCPTALALLEQEVPDGLDGRVATEMLDDAFLAAHPVATGGAVGARDASGEYSETEAEAVAAHLKDLGYID